MNGSDETIVVSASKYTALVERLAVCQEDNRTLREQLAQAEQALQNLYDHEMLHRGWDDHCVREASAVLEALAAFRGGEPTRQGEADVQ